MKLSCFSFFVLSCKLGLASVTVWRNKKYTFIYLIQTFQAQSPCRRPTAYAFAEGLFLERSCGVHRLAVRWTMGAHASLQQLDRATQPKTLLLEKWNPTDDFCFRFKRKLCQFSSSECSLHPSSCWFGPWKPRARA
jgi:hypothetical protein